jgi:MoaA/NifB/PqqE/SkfB family radical SAM enzyme
MLLKKAWVPPDHPVKYINFNTWVECNLTCDYCDYMRNPAKPAKFPKGPLIAAMVQDMFARNLVSPDGYVAWGGGEVTNYKDFPAMMALFAANGIRQNVNTNAVIFSPEIESALRDGSVDVQISIDSGTPATYAAVKGRDVFDRVAANIARYCAAGAVTLKYIIKNSNSADGDIDGFIALCADVRPSRIILVPEKNEQNSHTFEDGVIRGAARLIVKGRAAALEVTDDHRHSFQPDYLSAIDAESKRLKGKAD